LNVSFPWKIYAVKEEGYHIKDGVSMGKPVNCGSLELRMGLRLGIFLVCCGLAKDLLLASSAWSAELENTEPSIRDLECSVEILRCSEGRLPSMLLVTFQLAGLDRFKIHVDGRLAREGTVDFFDHKVGATYLLRDQQWIAYEPFSNQVYQEFLPSNGVVVPALSHVWGTGDLAQVGPYVANRQYLDLLPHGSFEERQETTPDGRTIQVVEVQLERPVRTAEPHTIVRQVWWLDLGRMVPIRVLSYDKGEQIVEETSFADFAPGPDGRWGALRSETKILPGNIPAQWGWEKNLTEKSETVSPMWRTDIPRRQRTINRWYTWVGQWLLPRRTDVLDDNGNLIFRCNFFNYVINAGVPESVWGSSFKGMKLP